MTDIIKKNTLLDPCLNNNGDIFNEIRNLRRSVPTIPSMIDDVTSDVENHFAELYRRLYNSVDDHENLQFISKEVNNKIDQSCIKDVMRITPELVQKAISHLEHKKNDPVSNFSSDCLKYGYTILSEYITMIFRHQLIHGHTTSSLMLSTIIPLVKDKLGNICSSSNYRSIAIRSLILKIFDWVILLLHNDHLETDELQFGFQEKSSTSMCTWMTVETIDYFQRHGSEVFVCVMDMTKAFDNVKHSTLFKELIIKGMPAIFTRLCINNKLHAFSGMDNYQILLQSEME